MSVVQQESPTLKANIMISRPLLFFDLLFLSSIALLPKILTATYQLISIQRLSYWVNTIILPQ